MKKWIKDKNDSFAESPEHLTPEQADRLLQSIMDNLDFDSDEGQTPPADRSYRYMFIRRYIAKNMLIIAGVFLFLFLLIPGTLIPAPISNVSAAPSDDASSACVEFKVSCLIPVQNVSAEINDHPVELEETGYQSYSVNVKENGYLLLEVLSASGMRSTHEVKIDNIDDQAPHIVSHHRDGNTVVIYLSDEDGSGVDYASIRAYIAESDLYVFPAYYDEKKGYVAFEIPDKAAYISVPDKNGNEMTAVLTPPDSAP